MTRIPALDYARANNKTFYNGRDCKKCGGNVRYTSNRKCVNCKPETAASHTVVDAYRIWKKSNAYNKKPQEFKHLEHFLTEHDLELSDLEPKDEKQYLKQDGVWHEV